MRKKPEPRKNKKDKELQNVLTTGSGENSKGQPETKPVWVTKTRTLFWCEYLVLRLKQPAENLVLLLDDIQQAGWPRWRKNPFTDEYGQDPREVLHDALKGLRKHKENKLLVFRGDGSGDGWFWELSKKALALLRKNKPK